MRFSALLFLAAAVAGSEPAVPPMQPSCIDDYVTIETVEGTIIEIKLAPEPFRSADIFLKGPALCERMWMQVLKSDIEGCRAGGGVRATGIITSDPEDNAWQINPVWSEYLRRGQDFICR